MPVTIADLPTELLVKIILHLDWRSVLRFQQVNKTFNEIVREHVAVRYHLELGIAGLVDAPPSSPSHVAVATTDERLRRLKTYNARWRNLDFSSPSPPSPSAFTAEDGTTTPHGRVTHIPKLAGSTVWELAGGVLGQGLATNVNEHIGRSGVRKVMFTRLPGGVRVLRPIARGVDVEGEVKKEEGEGEGEGEQTWTHEGYEFPIRDFTMDPSQDLLVLLRESTGSVGVGIGIGAAPAPAPAPGLGPGLGLGNIPSTSTGTTDASGDSDPHPHPQNVAEVHLRSLRTNEPHPLAQHAVFVHALHGGTRGRSHSLQICQDKLAVLHEARAGHFPEKLVVYEWMKGEMVFEISFCGIMSFAFLTPNHLLFAVQPFNVLPACQGDHQPRLLICDIERTKVLSESASTSVSASVSNANPVNPLGDVSSFMEGRRRRGGKAKGRGRPVEAYVALAEFHLPELKQYADVFDITIRVDPPPLSPSPPSPAPMSNANHANNDINSHTLEHASLNSATPIAVPAFTLSSESRLFVITLHVETVLDDTGDHRASEHVAVGIFVPLKTFLAFLPSSASASASSVFASASQGKQNEWEREPEVIPSNSDDEALYFGDFSARPARRIAVPWREWMQPSPSPSPSPSLSPSPSPSPSLLPQSAPGSSYPDRERHHPGARALLLPGAVDDTIWVCNVSGTRCVYALEQRDVVVPLAPRRVAVYEFGEGVVRREGFARREREGEALRSPVGSPLPLPPPTESEEDRTGRPQSDEVRGETTTRTSSSSSLSSTITSTITSTSTSSSDSASTTRSSSPSSSYSPSLRLHGKHKPHVETVLTPSTLPASSSSSTSSSSSSVSSTTTSAVSSTSTPEVDADDSISIHSIHSNNGGIDNGIGVGVFDEDVTTSLPYRRTVLREKKRFDGVMMTEDSLVFVSHRAPRVYEVWTI